jgi:hypothetical protein
LPFLVELESEANCGLAKVADLAGRDDLLGLAANGPGRTRIIAIMPKSEWKMKWQ